MSAAASDLVVEQAHERLQHPSGTETPRHQAPAGSAVDTLVSHIDISHGEPIIALDMDDVLSQTNEIVAKWHNEAYGTNMTVKDFLYYHYWKNPYWGTPDETFQKVEDFWKTNYIEIVPPVEGAPEGVKKLRELGFRLVVVTARQEREMERGKKWLAQHFPGLIDGIVCTGQSQETLGDNEVLLTKLPKAEVCHKLGAKLLIDDSLENALKCVQANPPVPVILFGDNEWNKRESTYKDISQELSFEQRLEKEGPGKEWWKEDEKKVQIPEGAPLVRVKDWEEVVRWVEEAKKSGKL
ncbi:hypothetical protein K474DRAFT_1658267 [Panus rudis PR-1116 ss-1]|nr:hypothetical protein K474DRAFT_1658267 [Panus rudis PR-1116 ss-1]